MRKYIFMAILCATVLISCGSVAADQTIIPSNADANLTVSNDAGARFDHIGNESYNFFNSSSQSASQGQNALHITTSNSSDAGNVTFTTAQFGTFFMSDTGGRGWDDNGILMLAINGTIPDNFWVRITASGYQWDPLIETDHPTPDNMTYVPVTLNETFTKDDFLYGPQTWKPCPAYNYSIFEGQDMSNSLNTFNIMFIDLWAGIFGPNTRSLYPGVTFIDNGMIKITYEFYNLPEGSLAAFGGYAYCEHSKQGEGVRWVTRVGSTGASGYNVIGVSAAPVADFSTDVTSGTVPLTVHFTDNSSGTNPLTYAWDFNNDGIIDSTEQNPTYTYTATGTYTAKLTVTNTAGSSEKTITINTSTEDIVAPTPSADLPSGSCNADQIVNLSATDDWDANPKIYYTLDGSIPTTSSALYTGPISINGEGTVTLNFIAVDDTGNISNMFTRTYTIDKTSPTVIADPVNGTYNEAKTVTLTTTDANPTTTYYTTDGSDPRTSSTKIKYTSPIAINTTTRLRFAAVDAASNWSTLYDETYTMVDIAAPIVSIDLPDGSYTTDQVAKLSVVDELDPHPKIYYTKDGSNPTINSTLYEWPIDISLVGTTVLKVMAVDAAGHTSDIATRIYMLDKPGASGTWNSTIVDTNIMYNSIAVDASGNPHIAYYQMEESASDYRDLKYAYKDQTGWHIETLETTKSGSGFFISLVLDSLGNPHIAYKQSTPDKLKYAYKDASGWHFFDLATNIDVSNINLVLYEDKPQISYYANTEDKVKYMYYDGTIWITEIVTSTPTYGHWNSLTLNDNGNPRISFYVFNPYTESGILEYAKRTPTGIWQITTVDDSGDVGMWNSLATDSLNYPRISYIGDNGVLKYAYWDNAQWNIEIVDTLKSTSCKLILDQSDNPRIVYQDFVTGNLKYAYKEGLNWTINNIDTLEGANLWISLTLSPSGNPCVSYMSANARLKYANLVPFTVSADPKGGSYEQVQTVNLTSTSGTTIYYTTDVNEDPRTSNKRIKYTAPIAINNTTTIKFAAVDNANNWSNVYTETYAITDITGPTVTANPVSGTYNEVKSVTLTTTDVNPTTTYYTTDGSDPRTSNTRIKYTGAIAISSTTTLNFAAVDAVGNWGSTCTETYVINLPSFTVDQIKEAASTVRSYIETYYQLPESVTINGTSVSMSQFLELLTSATLQAYNGTNDPILLKAYSTPTNPVDDIRTGNLPKSEYLKIASDVKNFMDSTGKTPDYAYQTSLGTHLGFQNLVYMYSMVLDYYNASGKWGDFAIMKPWSSISSKSAGIIANGPTFTIAQIKEAASTVRGYIETYYQLPESVTINGYSINMAQFLELLATATLQANNGNNNPIPLRTYNTPTNSIDDIKTGSLPKSEYLKIASDVKNFMDTTGKTPDYAYQTSLGTHLGFHNLVYMYSMVLDYYNASGKWGDFATMKPWSAISSKSVGIIANGPTFTIAQIKDAAARVKAYIDAQQKFPDTITINGIDVNMAQFLELLASAALQINNGNNNPIPLRTYNTPTNSIDDIKTGSLPKSEYLKIASDVKNFMDTTGKTPDYAYQTSLGTHLGFHNLVYMYSMVLDYCNSTGSLPNFVSMEPWRFVSSPTIATFTIEDIKKAGSTVRAYIETYYQLPSTVTINGISMSMSQFLELSTTALLQIYNGTNNPILLKAYSTPTNPVDDIRTGNLLKSEYMKIASDVKNFMDSTGKTPDYAYQTSLGAHLGFQNLVYMYSMVLDYYNISGKMGDLATMKPWSSISSKSVGIIANGPTFTIAQIEDAASIVKTSIETNHQLPDSVNINGADVNMAQFLELIATATLQSNNGNNNPIPLRNYNTPTNSIDDIKTGNLPKSEYLKIANDVKNFMDTTGKTPDYAYQTSLGTHLGFQNLVYMYSKILDYHKTNGNLPDYTTMKSWSTI